MSDIFQAETDEHYQQVKELFWEYLEWANSMVNREFGVSFDIKLMLEQDMVELIKFSPPAGRLLLAHADSQLAGIACLRLITDSTGEIKRMYVRTASRVARWPTWARQPPGGRRKEGLSNSDSQPPLTCRIIGQAKHLTQGR